VSALPELVGVFTAAALRVDLEVDGHVATVPTLVDWGAYRIVQEALTNVARHAPGSSPTVTVRFHPQEVDVSVIDHGWAQGGNRPYRESPGVIGMRERAAALGGTLDASPSADGFAVVAHLPRSSFAAVRAHDRADV
jgi:signal transduction histidine kinase